MVIEINIFLKISIVSNLQTNSFRIILPKKGPIYGLGGGVVCVCAGGRWGGGGGDLQLLKCPKKKTS